MNFSEVNSDWKVEKIEWVCLIGERPRSAGCNARLGVHGKDVPIDLVRVTIGGKQGFGWSRISKESATEIIGLSINELFTIDSRVKPNYYSIEFPLLDWLGQVNQKPVYELITGKKLINYNIPCYDTSLYFNDLHCTSDAEAVDLLQSQVKEGLEKGHRSFKIKVGRGAMHMPIDIGMKRDIAIIMGVRKVAGPDASIMVDANNGYNLNLTKELLMETAEANLTWIEEPFHEDPKFLSELKIWLKEQDLNIMIVDGEGEAALPIVKWAKEGFLDGIQYDIRSYGFHKWLKLGSELDAANVKTAPHNYGGSYGNYALVHLAPSINNFLFIEWDEMRIPGVNDSAYVINEGKVTASNLPGFGLKLDHSFFSEMVSYEGWSVELKEKQNRV